MRCGSCAFLRSKWETRSNAFFDGTTERYVKPRRPDPATRVILVVLSRLLDWRALLTVVQPDTLIRWHRQGWRLLWRRKSRPGRPPIPRELQRLIVSMAQANSTWGEERIASELLLKLGLAVSPRTVGRYIRSLRPRHGGRRSQRWATFVRNHAHAVVACDFFTTVTVRFRVLYVFVVLEVGTRRILRWNVTSIPRRSGRSSSFAWSSPRRLLTGSSSTIGIASLRQRWTWRSRRWAGTSSRLRRGRRRPTRFAKD